MKKQSKNTNIISLFQNIDFFFPEKKEYYEKLKNKIQPNKKTLIAVSGGADSMLASCLIYNFFLENKYNLQNLFFIHCNHNTRIGNKKDEILIQHFFKGTQIYITKRNTNHKTTEEKLRNRRYQEFKKHIQTNNIDIMILGHNLTDRIECSFLNLLRGANFNGFLSIQEEEEHHILPKTKIIRPLINLNKQEIIKICTINTIPFINDPTNNDNTISLRNKLRNVIFPELYKLAHKKNTTTNSFIESFKNIYKQLDYQQSQEKILLTPIPQSPHRKSTSAYLRNISPHDITTEKIVEVIKKLGIYTNITTPLLKERTHFFKTKESGYKYFKGTYGFIAHKKIYFITAPKFFWKKKIDTSYKITKLGIIRREGKTYSITTKEYKNTILRYPKENDIYKKKNTKSTMYQPKNSYFSKKFYSNYSQKKSDYKSV